MAQIAQIAGNLIVAVNRDVLFLAENGTICQKLILPAIERAQIDPKKTADDVEDEDTIVVEGNSNEEQPTEMVTDELPLDYGKIQHIAASGNGNLLAITTADDKAVYLYKVSASSAELLSKRESSRTSNSLCFSPDSQHLLLADKTGDCFIFDCASTSEAESSPGKWILGHFSMVLDTLFTKDGRYIVSSDRDEKIRVSRYPQTHIIETYCLGHTEYVPNVALLPTHADSLLVSVSGDKTLRIWYYLTGIVAHVFELPAPALRMATRKVKQNCSHIAITLYGWDSLLVIYEVTVDGDSFSIQKIDEHHMEDVKDVTSIHFDNTDSLLLSTITDAKDVVRIQRLQLKDGKYTRINVDAWQTAIRDNLTTANVQFNADEISLLFKKKFDNIHNYQERKKRRIETKNNKKVRC